MRRKSIPEWILSVLLALIFLYAGGVKLAGAPAMIQEFDRIGIGQWFRYVTGLLEVSGAIGLLMPKFRLWATLQIAAVMIGATAVNLFILHLPALARVTGVLMALAFLVAWLCRPETTRHLVSSQ
jgi:putative oxidoreductase